MTSFHLQIVTPNGQCYDGQAERLLVPTIDGQVGILAHHINYLTGLGMGPAKITTDKGERWAACIGGILAVTNGEVTMAATTFEWADEIDAERARASMARGEQMLADPQADEETKTYAQARIKRAKVRISIAEKK